MESILASGGIDPYVCRVPQPLARVTLTGRFVQLEPLSHDHVAELVAAATADRSTFAFTQVPDSAAAMTRYVDTLLEQHARGDVLPFAQRRLDTGEAIGCTRFMEARWWRGRDVPDEVEIGGTWLAASAQRTPINTEAKLLLLTDAFERLGVWRVAICTDAGNQRSRDAIERIGATFEGTLRQHRPRYNTDPVEPRDSALYSVIDREWPAVRDRLRGMVDR
jgi:RimJ/RimL family protein N-acetyltransferase